MYKVELSILAKKQLGKLNKDTRKRIIKVLKRTRIRPHVHVKKLVDSPYYRLRVGDYRVILDIVDGNLIILIIEIGHRKEIYK